MQTNNSGIPLYNHQIGRNQKVRQMLGEFREERTFCTAGGKVGTTIPELNLTGSMYFITQHSMFQMIFQVYKGTCMRIFISTMFGN